MARRIAMSLRDLVVARDGSLSGPKIAALVAHVLFAVAFVHLTWVHGFIAEMWLMYGSFALGHAITDKATAQFKDFKEQQLKATTPTKE